MKTGGEVSSDVRPRWAAKVPRRPDADPVEITKTSGLPGGSAWSASSGFICFLTAYGALTLWTLILYVLHLRPIVIFATYRLTSGFILLAIAIDGTRRYGKGDGTKALGVSWPDTPDIVLGFAIGIGLYFATTALQYFVDDHISWLVSWYVPLRNHTTELNHGGWWAVGVLDLVIVPLGEEAVFRGFLYQGLRSRFSIPVAVGISAGLFALVHKDPAIMPAIFLDGVVLALAFEWRKTLAMPMMIHASILAAFLIHYMT